MENKQLSVNERILDNTVLANSLRVKLRVKFAGCATALRILEQLTDRELIQQYMERRPA